MQAFAIPWTEQDFQRLRAQKKTVGFVIQPAGAKPDAILGYAVCQVEGTKIQLLNLAVRSDRRRQGLGTRLIGRLKEVLSPARFRRLYCHVGETNLAAQIFFRSVGFRATYVERDFWGTGEDAYRFAYHVHCAAPAHSHCK